ncbi:hypothetical protein MOQ_000372 [Trypanosoma cruzi marinkellei]|uniref:Uncharacterized protein n=1 Tax=Trypanosoma cruzi marinkellei TaxID=85056 RepID=K2NWG4_TRYCR|nr:hypothetical protein MOQ_000372 [Trypanosoma cruzi marinkellei]
MGRCVGGTTTAHIVRWHSKQQQRQRHLLSLVRRCGTSLRESHGFHAVASYRVACRSCSSFGCGSRNGSGAMASRNNLHIILRTRRWIGVESNRYLHEQQEYIPSVCEVAEEVLTHLDPLEEELPIETERLLRSLHADALVALFEYFVAYRLRILLRFLRERDCCTCEASPLCEVLLEALAERTVELSSKHVAFIGALYSASGVNARLFPFILYHSRHSLRRTQAAQALRAVCTMRFSAVDTMTFGSTYQLLGSAASGTSLCTSALSSLMVRCMELEQTHEEYDIRGLLSQMLMRHYSRVQSDVRTACLWWVRRGLHKSDDALQTPVLEAKLDDAPSPVDAFAAMETASRSLSLPVLDAAYVSSLVQKSLAAACNWQQSTRMAVHFVNCEPVDNPALVLHQQLPTLARLHGELKLLALETLSQRVLEITQLEIVVGLAESVLRYCPSLSQILIHRMLQLSCLGKEGNTPSLTLTAMHRLLPHANVMDVLEGVMMHGVFTGITRGECSHDTNENNSLAASFAKCLAMHLPVNLVPAMFHRLYRQRELAAFRLSSFVLRVLLQALEYVASDALSCEDVECIQSFVRQERRKALPRGRRAQSRTLNEEHENGMKEENEKLLAAIEACVLLRCRNLNDDVLLQLTPTSGIPATDSCNAVAVTKRALTSLFGVRATTLVTTEAAIRERASLAWLYTIYRMSVSIMCELEALATLALRQGVQLRFSEKQRSLVELSESVDESLMLKDANLQVWNGKMDKDALRLCIEEWLLNNEKSDDAFRKLIAMLDEDEMALSSFLSYIAISHQDVASMKELRQRSPASNSVFTREDSSDGDGIYRKPLRPFKSCTVISDCTAEVSVDGHAVGGQSSLSSDGGGDLVQIKGGNECDGVAESGGKRQDPRMSDLMCAAKCALCFAKEHWGDQAPAAVDAACLWANLDLLVLEEDVTHRLEHYETLLRLCQKDSLVGLAELVPAGIHRELFAVMGGKGLWAQGVTLLSLAESTSRASKIPVEAYQQVMRACLMHRVPVPAFLRERIKDTASMY